MEEWIDRQNSQGKTTEYFSIMLSTRDQWIMSHKILYPQKPLELNIHFNRNNVFFEDLNPATKYLPLIQSLLHCIDLNLTSILQTNIF